LADDEITTQPPRPKPAKKKARAKKTPSKATELARARTAAQQQAAQLAQIVNLHIAGYSLNQIGLAIGASPDEVDRLLSNETARYVRTQPALRTYVRNWVSEKYMKMIEADWAQASDASHPQKLEHQDRVDRFLRSMARLHGAEAPVQSEVKVEAAPEAVEQLVSALATQQGLGYDTSVFDVVDAEVVHDAVEESAQALEVSGNQVEESDGDDRL